MTPIRTLSGLRFRCPSPSVYCLEGLPLAVIFQGDWYVFDLRDETCWNPVRPFGSVEEAAILIAKVLKIKGAA